MKQEALAFAGLIAKPWANSVGSSASILLVLRITKARALGSLFQPDEASPLLRANYASLRHV